MTCFFSFYGKISEISDKRQISCKKFPEKKRPFYPYLNNLKKLLNYSILSTKPFIWFEF